MQLLIGQMIEKPIDQLTEYVSQQVIDNPALEVNPDGDSEWSDDGGEPQDIGEPQESRLDYDSDDIPVYEQNSPRQDPSDSLSFYDSLKEQMGTTQLTDRQRTIMEYLIGSLDNDGLLRKDIGTIGDEMASTTTSTPRRKRLPTCSTACSSSTLPGWAHRACNNASCCKWSGGPVAR